MKKNSRGDKMDFIKAYEKVEDLWNELPVVKKRKRRQFLFQAWKYTTYVLIAVVVVLIVWLGAAVWDLKSYYTHTVNGKVQLERAVTMTKNQDFAKAERAAEQARTDFSQVSSGLRDLEDSIIWGNSPFFSERIRTYRNLSEVALLLSRSLEKGASFGAQAQELVQVEEELAFSELSLNKKQKLLEFLYENLPELRGIKANLDLAMFKLDKVDTQKLFPVLRPRVKSIKEKMRSQQEDWTRFLQMASLVPFGAGYPDKSSFLVLFQNNTELRPTGGFLGTYGILETHKGEISRFETHNVYHMDMPLEGRMNIEPPYPIERYLNSNWYMRDSNWSPDWPTAASKIEWFYHKENQMLLPSQRVNDFAGDFDGVIGITPQLGAELLAITGPVEVEGKKYDQHNFVDLLQYQVEKGYKKTRRSSWDRKEVVGKILKKLKVKIFNLPSSEWSRVTDVFRENIVKKNILFHFENDHYQQLIEKLNGAGKIKDSPGDYLMVVDSNMGALKTDAAIERSIDYSLEKGVNGVFADLRIKYSHNKAPNWKISDYKSYTRILVPRGSELIEMDRNNLTPSQKRAEVKKKEIQGKTSFGTYFRLEPKEIGELHLKYKLPSTVEERIEENNSYQLLVQKQPGTTLKDASIDINLPNKIKSYQPVGFYAHQDNPHSVNWNLDISGDKMINIDILPD